MKRRDLVNHLTREGCIFQREGSKHSVYLNPENGHIATVPRHREIEILLARKICRQLDIPIPRTRA
ncbi:MAG: addiction module toxin, HicA family [Chloroflexi bacterium CG08_land_8_20_14_0_20_45_12]|nr:MAG: addiction module toxin, HicA family [Chloroflexi bacterium CG08_land_8_20_14_0_20_45_12]PIX27695.1 MAG: addiction module toxin, HicA family [Chloroflexi bacterium CG_4_8_14_3_um_filter_45_15]